MEQFKQKFIDEAVTLLINLETVVLELESDPENKDYIQQVFRVMHTLKGVSGMYGFDSISEYTHHLENIYDFIREEKVALNNEILNLTFESIDHLKNLLQDEMLTSDKVAKKHFELMYRVTTLATKIEKEAIAEPAEAYGFFEDLDNTKTFYIVLSVKDDFVNKGINLLEIFRDLSNIGEYRIMKHTFFEPIDESSDTLGWGIYLITNRSTQTVEDVFLLIMEYCSILRIANFNLFDKQEFNERFNELKAENDPEKSKNIQQSILQLIEKYNNENIAKMEQDQLLSEVSIETEIAEIIKTIEPIIGVLESKKLVKPEIKKEIKKEEIAPKETQKPKKAAAPLTITTKPEPEKPTINNITEKPAKSAVSIPEQNQAALEIDSNDLLNKQVTSRISVDAAKLDTLMYLVSELVTTKAQLNIIAERRDYARLDIVAEKIDKLTKGFRDNALSIRLVPVNDVAFRFKRLIRDLSQKMGKDIKFVTSGTETELDKSIIDALADPVMHIIRNSIDHGIEMPEVRKSKGKLPQGIITFNAFHSGTNVFIQIQDDGKGIDTDKLLNCAIENGFVALDAKLTRAEILNLIFIPGLTTAQNITDISGRGVGMDVVKRKIAEIRGDVEVESSVNVGTSIMIKLQQTVSIIDTLLIQASNTFFMIPLSEIEVCDQRDHSELFQNNNRQVSFNNNLVPYIHLRSEFQLENESPAQEKVIFVVKNDIRFGIVADKIIGEHQAVLKPPGKMFRQEEFLSGISVLGDGNMALMLDTNKLMQLAFLM